jgi:phosphoribosylanthranilate isomerase
VHSGPGVETVAVVGGDTATILALVEHVQPDVVQLHLDESEKTVRDVRQGLAGSGVAIVKAVRITVDAGAVAPAAHWLDVARRFVDAGADRILLDSKTSARPAGTGIAFDWSIAREVAGGLEAPLLLAGGLTPENVGDAVAEVRPFGVDVISSIEDAEHRKVPPRVSAFVVAVRGARPSGGGADA